MVATATQLLIFKPVRDQADRPTPSHADVGFHRQILMDRVVDLLVQKAVAQVHWPEVYSQAEQLLQTVVLAADKRRVAFRRMYNAKSYATAGEFGAAAYELRMLRTQLI